MFSFTSFSVFPWVAISKIGHEATNHLFSFVIRIGRGTWIDMANRRAAVNL